MLSSIIYDLTFKAAQTLLWDQYNYLISGMTRKHQVILHLFFLPSSPSTPNRISSLHQLRAKHALPGPAARLINIADPIIFAQLVETARDTLAVRSCISMTMIMIGYPAAWSHKKKLRKPAPTESPRSIEMGGRNIDAGPSSVTYFGLNKAGNRSVEIDPATIAMCEAALNRREVTLTNRTDRR